MQAGMMSAPLSVYMRTEEEARRVGYAFAKSKHNTFHS